MCAYDIYIFIFFIIIFSIRLYAGLNYGQIYRNYGHLMIELWTDLPLATNYGQIYRPHPQKPKTGHLPPQFSIVSPPFGSMKTDARTLNYGHELIEIWTFRIDNIHS